MASDLPQDLQTALREMVTSLHALKLPFTLIGGLAVGYRSRPRFTRDIDFLLHIPSMTLPGLLEGLRDHGFTFDTEKTIREWTKDHMTVLTYHGVNIDWLKPVLPVFQHVIDRASTENFLGLSIPIASPECLIVTKLIAFRGQDQVDIENLLAANPGHIDLDFIRSEWLTIADDHDPRYVKFQEIVEKSYLPVPPDGSSQCGNHEGT